jgi:hypothetical protein
MVVCKRKILGSILMAAVLAANVILLSGQAAVADDSSDVRQQIEALQKKVEALEKQASGSSVRTSGAKGYFELPGADTEIRIGGYAKLDLVYSDVSAGDKSAFDQFYGPTTVPLHSSAVLEENQTVLHARQSRINIATASNTDYGKLTTFFEGDFFGAGGDQTVSNSYALRLRHFYGQLGKVLAGQTWTTFQVVESIPETLDFGGPAAAIFIRQAQVRWTEPMSFGSLQFSLENPETTYYDNLTASKQAVDDDTLPDMIARANIRAGKGIYSVGLMIRNLRFDDGVDDDDVWGGAVMAGGRIPVMEKDDIRFQLMYGNALGRYMNTGFAGAMMDGSDHLDALDQWGGFVAYRHMWKDGLRSSLIYSFGQADNNLDRVAASANETIQSAHANLIWSPVPKVDLGIEYIYGAREQEDGRHGELNRFQMSAQYNFF